MDWDPEGIGFISFDGKNCFLGLCEVQRWDYARVVSEEFTACLFGKLSFLTRPVNCTLTFSLDGAYCEFQFSSNLIFVFFICDSRLKSKTESIKV